MNPENFHDNENDISFEEQDDLLCLLYTKIASAVDKRQKFAILFSGISKEKDEAGEGYSAIITDDQFKILLENFLLWCENLERYEKCQEINKTILKLNKWIEKN